MGCDRPRGFSVTEGKRWADPGSRWADQLPAFQAVSQTVSVLVAGLLCKYSLKHLAYKELC